ncbi:MAG TPA: hypothetical protein VGA50_04440 [Kiloniellales bacterium]
MTKTRLQFDLVASRVAELDQIMADCGIDTRKELFDNALTLLQWAVREVKRGNIIASVNEREERYRELQMPILLRAAGKSTTYESPDHKHGKLATGTGR